MKLFTAYLSVALFLVFSVCAQGQEVLERNTNPPQPSFFGESLPPVRFTNLIDYLPKTSDEAALLITGPALYEAPNMPSLLPGDAIVGVNDQRVQDLAEYHLAITSRPQQNDPIRLHVLREGKLIDVSVVNPIANSYISPLRLSRRTICGYPTSAPRHPLSNVFQKNFPNADFNTQLSLEYIPRRLATTLPDESTQWLPILLQNYVALCAFNTDSYQHVDVPENAGEWAWFDAVMDAAHGDFQAKQWSRLGDLHRAGIPPWFTALAFPVPYSERNDELVKGMSDITYNFRYLVANGAEPDEIPRGIDDLYSVLAGNNPSSGNRYLNLIALAMTSWERQGGWPFRMRGLEDPAFRAKTLDHIDEIAEDQPEWAQIAQLAKMIILAIEGEHDLSISIAKELNKESALLGYLAKRYLLGVVKFRKLDWSGEPIADMYATPAMSTSKALSEFYKHFKKQSVFSGEYLQKKGTWLNGHGSHRVLNDFRIMVYAASVPNFRALGSLSYDYRVTLRQFNTMIYHSIHDITLADKTDAKELVALSTWRYRHEGAFFYRLTMTSLYCLLGDFEGAAHWHQQDGTTVDQNLRNTPTMEGIILLQGDHIAARKPVFITNPPGELAPTSRSNDDGVVTGKGFLHKGKRWGQWIFFHANGTRSATGLYHNDRQIGYWTSYDEQGNKTREGRKFGGNFVGPWRGWSADGWINAQGWYAGKTGKDQTGTWEHYHANGTIKESGLMRKGQRVGIWKEYDADGTLLAEGFYEKGKKSGIWRERNDAQGEFQGIKYLKGNPDGEVLYGDEFDKL